MDTSDPDDIFEAIKNSMTEPDAYIWFLRALRNLLMIPDDKSKK